MTTLRRILPLLLLLAAPLAADPPPRFPHVVLLSVDTLRADRVSILGRRERRTTPKLDALLARGARFTAARTPEPLTGPAMVSVLTGLHPHDHGATRNGMAMRPGLPTLPRILDRRGYRTAAFVGNWTLRGELTGLGPSFDVYREVFTRKRWLGLFNDEADARDVTDAALGWLRRDLRRHGDRPRLLWVHYVDPHAPYRRRDDVLASLGVGAAPSKIDRYDGEVAWTDRHAGRLLDELELLLPSEHTLVVFLADHGESLGEHDYWGHGRHVYDASLRVPLGFTWRGEIPPRTRVDARVSTLDVLPTVLALLGLPPAPHAAGVDLAPVLRGEAEPDAERVTWHQAHRGAARRGGRDARTTGLLEVALVTGTAPGRTKEVLDLRRTDRRLFALDDDPREYASTVDDASPPSLALRGWLERVRAALALADDAPPRVLDDEAMEELRALGYLE